MERSLFTELVAWKSRPDRKPLILLGARQVGKTYLLKEFGRREFRNVAYINCDNNSHVRNLFASDFNVERVILTISAITGESIVPGQTLIILDEIQELPMGVPSLKYFCEDAPQYHIAVAGSLLGIALHKGESFPVGKVNTLHLHPMNFTEYLQARGKEALAKLLLSNDWSNLSPLHTLCKQMLREYYFVGGMPEAVLKFLETKDPFAVREVQQAILDAYDRDISKHAPTEQTIRINLVWHSIPAQLAKENRKFIYGMVRKGARAKDFEMALQWLIDAGLVHKVNRVKALSMPLKAFEDFSSFKLYMLDCGLLGAMSQTPPALLILPNNENQTKGDFTENFVCCEMKSLPHALPTFYFSKDNSQLELDFVIQIGTDILPVEVKAEENVQAKSLKTTLAVHPQMHALRFSMSEHRSEQRIDCIPLYATHAHLLHLLSQNAEKEREAFRSTQ